MLKREKTLLVLLPVVLAGFGFGVARLFQLRFESGDVYPAYSSLRTDPIGTKALYESFEALPRLDARRHIRPVHKLPEGRDTALFLFGTKASEMVSLAEVEFKSLERFMFEGGRIVVSFLPANTKPWLMRRDEDKEQKDRKPSGKGGRKPDEEQDESTPPFKKKPSKADDGPGMRLITLKERWGVEFGYADLPKDEEGDYRSVISVSEGASGLPEEIAWHTALYFDKPRTNWQTIYTRDSRPVVIERKFGDGSIVLSADSYFLSNEAMRKERYPGLLAWLVGRSGTVLFDESHLGVIEEPGIAGLIRKYRLHGLVIGLILLAGLFVWKNAVSLVPPPADDTPGGHYDPVAGKESAAGFVNLLRRSVASSDVVSVCFSEWKKSCTHGRQDLTDRMTELLSKEQSRPARERSPIETYQRMSRILSERK